MSNLKPVKDIIRTEKMKDLDKKELYTEDGRRLSSVNYYRGHLKELYYREKNNDMDVKVYVPNRQRRHR